MYIFIYISSIADDSIRKILNFIVTDTNNEYEDINKVLLML